MFFSKSLGRARAGDDPYTCTFTLGGKAPSMAKIEKKYKGQVGMNVYTGSEELSLCLKESESIGEM